MTKPSRELRIAIVGAGLSGLSCADELAASVHELCVFDKGRGPGGRSSTRRAGIGGVESSFDHGAQYFTVRDSRIARRLERWEADGVVKRWEGRIAVLGAHGVVQSYSEKPRYVGVPGMSALCEHLGRDQDVRYRVTVGRLERTADGVALFDQHGHALGAFDAAVVTAPPAQTIALVADAAPALAARASSVVMQPCWALMAAFEPGVEVPYDGAFVNDGPLSWVARTSSKPGRTTAPDRWVLHASAAWSRDHLEDAGEQVAIRLLDAFFEATALSRRDPVWSRAHRWRYALAENPLQEGCLFDAASRIAVCGDWTQGNRVEGALLAGLEAARRIEEALASE